MYANIKIPHRQGVGGCMIYVLGAVVVFIVIRKLTEPKVDHVTFNGLLELMKDGVKRQYVDVRTAGEFNSHKVKGFKNIPLQSIRNNLDKFSEDKQIVLICASGSRSMSAARVLKKAGYNNIVNVKGGIR
jgi:rhodanese-related sulfurtransferase